MFGTCFNLLAKVRVLIPQLCYEIFVRPMVVTQAEVLELHDALQVELELEPPDLSMESDLKEIIFKVGELYSGPGGVGLGAAKAEIRTADCIYKTEPAWVNDYDADSCETWKRNVLAYYRDSKGFTGNCDVIHGDVRNLDLEKLVDVDGLMFGFPCNDFSIVGEHKGFDGEFGPLYSYGVKILEKQARLENGPKWFLAENVGNYELQRRGLRSREFCLILNRPGIR